MIKQFIIKFSEGIEYRVNTSNVDSARFIAEGLFPDLKIVSIEIAV